MIQKDFVLRQIQQLVQVLVQVIQRKDEGREAEALALLDQSLLESLDMKIDDLLVLEKPALLALCSSEGRLSADLALVLAELLEERGYMLEKSEPTATAQQCFRRALDLYEAIVATATAVPIDVYERISRLKGLVDVH